MNKYKKIKIQKECDSEFNDLVLSLKKIFNESPPLAKLFRTDSRGYIYDTGTNKLLSCNEIVYNLLLKLFSSNVNQAIENYIDEYGAKTFIIAANTVISVIKKECILSLKSATPFGISRNIEDFKERINTSLEILFLELSEACNLRCDYCVYNNYVKTKRNHGRRHMSLSTAQLAIQYLYKHSFKRKKISLGFYGGEPLLKFDLLQSIIHYAGIVLNKDELNFSITTNGTLVNNEIADFFARNNFSIHVSLDGPEEIHNEFRKDKKGIGSFNRALKGIKYLVDAYGDLSKKKISLSMVYTPPFSSNRIEHIASLWNEFPWLPKEMNLNITYPSPGTILKKNNYEFDLPEDKNLQQWAFETYKNRYLKNGTSHPIADSIMEHAFAILIQRPIYKTDINQGFMNGCCIPGVRRIYVDVTGKFHLCEKISTDAPVIGSVKSGINQEVIDNVYINGYEEMCKPNCSKCWVVRLCDSCFAYAFENGALDVASFKKQCTIVKETQEKYLRYYCMLMEFNPFGLDYLYDRKME